MVESEKKAQARVLHVFGSLDRGGAESMVMSLYRNVDRRQVQFDFAVSDSGCEYAHEQEIRKLGGRVYHLPNLRLQNLNRYIIAWSALLENHPEWKVIHIHHTSSAAITIPIARRAGRTTIAHSHTAGSDGSLKARLKIVSRYPVRYLADHLLACSVPSARWMFGSKSTNAIVLKNAIDVDSFLPDERAKKRIRAEMGFEQGQKVIGHVGSFIKAKNHTFMLEVLQALVRESTGVVMLFIGDGPLKGQIVAQSERMGIAENLVCTGARSDIPDLMQAMDAFIFPSLHEGLPVTLVECQASGLPCLVSDSVSQDAKLTACIDFMSLNASADRWAKRLWEISADDERPNNRHALSEAGYDVKDNAIWLESFYRTMTDIT